MPLGERDAGTRLEVLLKGNHSSFVGEFDDHVQLPPLSIGRVRAATRVMSSNQAETFDVNPV